MKARQQTPAETKEFYFGRILIDGLQVTFQKGEFGNYVHELTEAQYGKLCTQIRALANSDPDIVADSLEMPTYQDLYDKLHPSELQE